MSRNMLRLRTSIPSKCVCNIYVNYNFSISIEHVNFGKACCYAEIFTNLFSLSKGQKQTQNKKLNPTPPPPKKENKHPNKENKKQEQIKKIDTLLYFFFIY